MKNIVIILILSIVSAVTTPVAVAGPYTDDMSKCLVRSTTLSDKTLLVRWMFATMALHPDVQDLSNVSGETYATLSKKYAKLMERLLVSDCQNETRNALKYEGSIALETSFGVLGKVATRALFTNQKVIKGMEELQKNLDVKKLGALGTKMSK